METKLFELYKKVLIAHIESKTTYSQFHEKTQEFYELLFECFHSISEKKQDLGLDKPTDDETLTKQVYDSLEEAKSYLETMIKWKNSVWMDNLLRGLCDKLENACWNAKAFIEEEQEEVKEPKKVLNNKL